jgi:CheY-like chemotaxis protein
LSKIEAGELVVESAVFSPRDLLTGMADVMRIQADSKGIGFKLNIPADLPAALTGDAARLKQILTNLVSNAIKFTDHGSVELSVRRMAAKAMKEALCFIVSDSGIGIAPEARARLFKPFAQADASITRRYGGTGLGLSIVKRLAQLLGGEVVVTSMLGLGSQFTVMLEFDAVLASSAEVQAAPAGLDDCSLDGVRVLVVDDSDINLEVAKRILELKGARVGLAVNGQAAFLYLQAEPDAFDVVLMDVQMPLMDGLTATRLIRGELGLADLPIIALTAGALSSERPKVIAAGMNDFITKPFEPRELVRSVRDQVRRSQERRNIRPPPAAAPNVMSAWPSMDGIDYVRVRALLGDDAGLFRSLLGKLISDFAGVTLSATGSERDALLGHGARMHKLRGSAGILGLKVVQQLATAIECACEAGDLASIRTLAQQLTAEFRRLSDSVDGAVVADAA